MVFADSVPLREPFYRFLLWFHVFLRSIRKSKLHGQAMTGPIISPDGKWMWTGSEWIPAPPTSASADDSIINLGDSVISGNVNIELYPNDSSPTNNLRNGGILDGICPSCSKMKENTDCVGCGENFCKLCSNHPEVCDPCYKLDLQNMVNLKGDLRLHDRYWASFGIGFLLQFPFSLSAFLFDPDLLGLFDIGEFLLNLIWNVFVIILGVFWIAYPGYLYFICGVRPNDEKVEELSSMEQEYGKLTDLDLTILES